MSKTLSLKFSKILRPNNGLIDPGPLIFNFSTNKCMLLKQFYNMSLRILPSQHREVSVILLRIAWWSSAGKVLFFWLPSCVVVFLMPSLVYVFFSHLRSWPGYEI